MSFVSGNLSIRCAKCGKQHDFTADDADFDATSGSEEPMGMSNGYTWEYGFDCDACSNPIEIEYEVWEYPEGAFNHDQINVKGGTAIGGFSFDFQGPPDEY